MKNLLSLVGVVGAALLVLAFLFATTINPGERGVSVVLGKASTTVLDSGVYFRVPFIRSVRRMNVQVQKTDISDAKAGTKDLQDVDTHAILNWHILPEDVVKIYVTIGSEDDLVYNIIGPVFNEILKAATAKKTAEEVLTRRAELKDEVDEKLTVRLKSYGIFVDDVNIIDVQFSKDFTAAVEQKQVAEQRAKQAEYEAQQQKNAAVGVVSAARGQADAQRLLRENITSDLLQMEAIKKWDGQLPQIMSGNGGAMPFINIGGVGGRSRAKLATKDSDE